MSRAVVDLIGSEPDLVAVCGQGRWVSHDACVAEQNIEAAGLRSKVLGSGGDRKSTLVTGTAILMSSMVLKADF